MDGAKTRLREKACALNRATACQCALAADRQAIIDGRSFNCKNLCRFHSVIDVVGVY